MRGSQKAILFQLTVIHPFPRNNGNWQSLHQGTKTSTEHTVMRDHTGGRRQKVTKPPESVILSLLQGGNTRHPGYPFAPGENGQH